ncbi:hypothetical protein [Virgibacillus ndiopensis]|uniref:hypothetical protein n=1 Tax=Virgibacillus ndiopensis TaxID=2004408 RepID=UPI000C06E2FE|nr:hypothetical protein [Virgibacillus ndiopensis]
MGYKFTDENKWARKGINGFLTAIIGFMLIIVQIYLVDSIDSLLFYSSFISVLIGLLQGIYYMNRTQHDYIFLEENCLSIYRGPLFPRKKIEYNDINYCVEMSGLIICYLKDDKEAQFNTEWLSVIDVVQIKKQLKLRVKVENVFRTEAENYRLFGH